MHDDHSESKNVALRLVVVHGPRLGAQERELLRREVDVPHFLGVLRVFFRVLDEPLVLHELAVGDLKNLDGRGCVDDIDRRELEVAMLQLLFLQKVHSGDD